ncbi:hypothetical protein [Wolbachia endosymbiont of Psylliodes chrysocephala]|nr:hypothetical protein [Wolbachia endosymbiont of Psylliodes chrysocephala]
MENWIPVSSTGMTPLLGSFSHVIPVPISLSSQCSFFLSSE